MRRRATILRVAPSLVASLGRNRLLGAVGCVFSPGGTFGLCRGVFVRGGTFGLCRVVSLGGYFGLCRGVFVRGGAFGLCRRFFACGFAFVLTTLLSRGRGVRAGARTSRPWLRDHQRGVRAR